MSPPDHEELHPRDGARFLLERVETGADDSWAVYRASIFTPDARFYSTARITSAGGLERTVHGSAAPAPLEQTLDNLSRSLGRAAGRKLEEQLPAWPHRVLRWRGPGRG
jgi:hypothetical protein